MWVELVMLVELGVPGPPTIMDQTGELLSFVHPEREVTLFGGDLQALWCVAQVAVRGVWSFMMPVY